jgi:hypothetical protein
MRSASASTAIPHCAGERRGKSTAKIIPSTTAETALHSRHERCESRNLARRFRVRRAQQRRCRRLYAQDARSRDFKCASHPHGGTPVLLGMGGAPIFSTNKTNNSVSHRPAGYPHQFPRSNGNFGAQGRGLRRCFKCHDFAHGAEGASTSGAVYGSGRQRGPHMRLKGGRQIPICWLTPTVGLGVGRSRHRCVNRLSLAGSRAGELGVEV